MMESITWIQRRGQIKHLLYEHCLNGRIDKDLLKEQFDDLNSVEPVVRCKDCVHWNGETKGCNRNPSVEPWEENDYCSYGERTDGGENDD